MSFAFGPPRIAGALNFGPGSMGVLGSAISSGGIDGPGYPYSSLDLPADASKEYLAWITTPPTVGRLIIDPTNYSFVWDNGAGGALPQGTHSFGFTLVEGGTELSPEVFVYAEVDLPTVRGAVQLDDAVASGAFTSTTIGISGSVQLDDAIASGTFAAASSALSGSVMLDDAVASGLMGLSGSLGGSAALDDAVASGTFAVVASSLQGVITLDDAQASGGLFVVDADPPLSTEELRFVRDLRAVLALAPDSSLIVLSGGTFRALRPVSDQGS